MLQDSHANRDFSVFGFGAIGIVLAITAEELLGYQAFSDIGAFGGIAVESYGVLCFAQMLLAAGLFFVSRRLSSFMGNLRVVVCGAVAALLGAAAVSATDLAGLPPVLALGGFFLLAAGCLLLKVMCLELLASVSLQWGKRMLFAAVLLQSFFAPVFALDGVAVWALACVALIAGIAFVTAAWARGRHAEDSPGEDRAFKKAFAPSAPVVVGFGILCVSVSFLNPLGLYPSIGVEGFILLTFGTHFAAALAFGACAFLFRDSSYSLAFRGINSVVLLAFTLLALLGAAAFLPRALCTMVFSLFEFVTFLAIADLASYTSTNKLKLFGCYYLIVRACSLAGLLLGTADAYVFPVDASFSVFGIALSILAIVAAVWLMTESTLNGFFWGNTLQGMGDRSASGGEAGNAGDLMSLVELRVNSIVLLYGLSQRERDVLNLMAIGRSSTFIAEELFLSSNTVRKHIAHIYDKCGVHSKQELLTLVQLAGGSPALGD